MIENNLYAWFVRGAEHAAMCRTSVESVRKIDPGSKCVVVTDEHNPSWDVPNVLLLHIDSGLPIMLANLEAQVSAMAVAWVGNYERAIFLDTDTLLLKRPECFGDIAFTWRDSIGYDDDGEKVEGIAKRMPYNYGVIIARPGIKSFEAFIWMRERIRAMHTSHQSWYGNQLAAAELAGACPKEGEPLCQIQERALPWKLTNLGKSLHIGKLPCETHNYTPRTVVDDVSDKFVLHFKGGRRHLMQGFAHMIGVNWYLPDQKLPEKPELTSLAMVASL